MRIYVSLNVLLLSLPYKALTVLFLLQAVVCCSAVPISWVGVRATLQLQHYKQFKTTKALLVEVLWAD